MSIPDDQTTPTTSTPVTPTTPTGGPGSGEHGNGAATPAPGAHSPDQLDTLRGELAEIAQKADEYLRLAQRTQADFVNYRRRIEDERLQQARDANLGFIQRLLPVLDDFERALANASPEQLESSWGKGILLVERNLRSVLASEEVQRITAEGAEFDPREHEALGRQPSAEVPEGHVRHVVRPGYRKGDRVIRPAQVIVASGSQPG
jgi:molecular chaperone GrpE